MEAPLQLIDCRKYLRLTLGALKVSLYCNNARPYSLLTDRVIQLLQIHVFTLTTVSST